ncbi:hypothetical protein AVKW3434_12175 [Acidovorax sp. SUPP3434]|uniref:hypothetical protein n=1 Tax=Acidovorax sp. SUPP3434 TaxID=2920880 RepID=UPI0023DE38A3|nr:hypothetical protein [Acidovorax sp. SUPP3434]GKT00146.1 hypothetical protein AVKW3434_12175 [Acidovorax sp. SUPP3434]
MKSRKVFIVGGLLIAAGAVTVAHWEGDALPVNRSTKIAPVANLNLQPLSASASGALGRDDKNASQPASAKVLVNGLKMPIRPVWQGVVDYRQGKKGRSIQEEVIAGLSFCASTELNREAAVAEKSRTGVTAQTAALDSMVKTQSEMCARLSDADYELRSEILGNWARDGDLDAMVAFYTAGPLGRWGATTGPQTLENPGVKEWQTQAVSWLNVAARQGQIGAFLLLSDVYDNKPVTERPGAVFSDLYDPVRSYAYAHAWHYLVGRDESKRQALLKSDFLNRAESGISKEQRDLGRVESQKIIESLGEIKP